MAHINTSARRPRPGRALEKLVALIERQLAGDATATIESPGYLPDRTTGKRREHDVLVKLTHAHHGVVIALECRDRSRPVGVDQIEAFRAKCDDTGVNQGIIVSPSGFYRSARTKAQHYGIRCLTLDEADSHAWLLASHVAVGLVSLRHAQWTLVPEDPSVQDTVRDFAIVDPQGAPLPAATLNANVLDKLRGSAPLLPPGKHKTRVVFVGDGTFLRDNSTGTLHPLRKLIANVEFEISLEFAPFRILKYTEPQAGAPIAEAAVADVTLGQTHGQLVALRAPGGNTTISFIPSSQVLPPPEESPGA